MSIYDDYEKLTAETAAFNALSLTEVDRILSGDTDENGPDDGYDGWWSEYETRRINGLGDVTLVQRVGGNEGGGDTVSLVFRVQAIDGFQGVRYFEKSGFYASYEGTEYDGPLIEVRPVQKTVTVFEEVQR